MIFKTVLASVLFVNTLAAAVAGIWFHATISGFCFAAFVLFWRVR